MIHINAVIISLIVKDASRCAPNVGIDLTIALNYFMHACTCKYAYVYLSVYSTCPVH